MLHHRVEGGIAGCLDQNGAHRRGVRLGLSGDRLADLDQVVAQVPGLRRHGNLAHPLHHRGQHQFRFGGPAPIHGGFAGPGGGRHLIDGEPLVSVLLQELQGDREQFAVPFGAGHGVTIAGGATRSTS